MTLVIARIDKGRIAVAADTLLTEHHSPLPFQRGTIKSCMLPGDICVSFSNSPVTAEIAFKTFCDKYRDGARFSEVVSFFEESSARIGVESNESPLVANACPIILRCHLALSAALISGGFGSRLRGDPSPRPR
jgi:hypothetical protein